MENENITVQRIRSPEFQFDARTGELQTAAARITLPPRLAELLLAIAERPGELVTREELYRRVWKGSHAQYRVGLDTAMKSLRKALSLALVRGVTIETWPRRGYRLILASAADPAGVPKVRYATSLRAVDGEPNRSTRPSRLAPHVQRAEGVHTEETPPLTVHRRR